MSEEAKTQAELHDFCEWLKEQEAIWAKLTKDWERMKEGTEYSKLEENRALASRLTIEEVIIELKERGLWT